MYPECWIHIKNLAKHMDVIPGGRYATYELI